MSPERWKEVEALFSTAADLDPSAQQALLAEVSARDPALADEVRSLLAADAAGLGILEATPSPTEETLTAGTPVGEYVIEQELGAGAFGTVYAARHPTIGKRAAIKVLNAVFSRDAGIVARFIAEARAVNAIEHPNIVDIFSFGRTEAGRPYFVMEYVEGAPLDRVLKESGPLPLAEALPILAAIASALDAAHGKSIVHRDLKPANVMLAKGSVKLLDFGIAKLLGSEDPNRHQTRTGQAIGTPAYMSPEQVEGRTIDHRSDIYSFGAMAYEMLAGVRPFRATSTFELMVKQVKEAPEPPSRHASIDANTEAWILRMLEKDPARRPSSLKEVIAGLTSAAPPKRDRRLLLPLGATAIVIVGLAVLSRPKEPEVVAMPPPPSEAPPPVAKPARLEVDEAPAGTEVFDGEGNRLGLAGDPIDLPAGDSVTLVFRAKGYRSVTKVVHPEVNTILTVSLAGMKRRLHGDLEDGFAR